MDYFDFHADTLTEITAGSLWENENDIDLKRAEALCRQYVQVFAIWKDAAKVRQREKEFYALYCRAMKLLADCENKIKLCHSGKELEAAKQQGKMAAFLSIEDISFMGSYVHQCRDLGFSFAMLTWNYENEYASGAVADQNRGLTEEGKRLVRELQQQQIILDVSHLSDRGIDDILSMSAVPVIASHSNVRSCQAQPRNLKEEHIREIIARGGIIGLNLYRPFVGKGMAGVGELREHIDTVLSLGGEKALAFGCDFDGCGSLLLKGIHGIQSMRWLKNELRQAGYGEELLNKIYYENGERFIRTHLK